MEELEKLVEETIARLVKKFDTDNLWRSTEGDTAYIAIGNLWESVGDEIRTAYTAGMERCLELLPKERSGDNDYPMNYSDGHNSCRSQVESAIKGEIKKV